MADFLITSLQGGLNEDSPISLADDECVVARNVEFVRSMLGERRRGTNGITITGSDLVGKDRVTFLHRHLPTTNQSGSELWAFGVTGTASSALCRKTTSWSTVTPVDAITLTDGHQYLLQAQTLHGKLFIAYKSGQDRLHVWDGTSLRRTGLAEPAAPTVANRAGVGTFSGTRYYRVRYVVMSGSEVLRRSEPSDSTEFSPSGSNTGATITKPASISESETHWELEASLDNSTFYRIGRVAVGTTTQDDTTNFNTGYAADSDNVLSEDAGDYDLIWSARYLTVDDDRLIFAGSFDDDDRASTVGWTPVSKDPGAGNDERIPLSTDNTLDLDNYEGGVITGLSRVINGVFYAFKHRHIYRLNRTGVRTNAYEVYALSKQRGAIPGSIIEYMDSSGQPTLFFLDPDVGPCYVKGGKVGTCGSNISTTWGTINLDATNVVVRSVSYPEHEQVIWFIATGDSNVPDLAIVLHTNLSRESEDGLHRGWVIWDCPPVLATTLYATNIEDNTDRSLELKPFIGIEGGSLILEMDTGTDDDGEAFEARILTKPYVHGNLLHRFGCNSGSLMAKATTGASLDITIVGSRADKAQVNKEVANISLTALSGEGDRVIRGLDNLSLQEMNTVQVEFEDSSPVGSASWELDQMALLESGGQRA